jgi:hypothetical protein
LNITNCWRNGTDGEKGGGMKWYAPDQPGYIPLAINPVTKAKEANYNECMGFVDFPATSDCSASYPTNARVCRCTATAPAPAPPPPGQAVVYTTVVWAYVWNTSDVAAGQPQHTHSTDAAVAMQVAAELGAAALLTPTQEDAVVDRVLQQDAGVIALLVGFAAPGAHPAVVRHLTRHMDW